MAGTCRYMSHANARRRFGRGCTGTAPRQPAIRRLAALGGRADGLEEYLVGVEVFDRAASFDPRIDTIVRVEAVKLRKRVQEYYRGPGRKDPVVIDLPERRLLTAVSAEDEPVVHAGALTSCVGRQGGAILGSCGFR